MPLTLQRGLSKINATCRATDHQRCDDRRVARITGIVDAVRELGLTPRGGGSLLATRVSGWDARSFFALEPPNGGGTSWIDGVSPPFGGFCHPRETDIHGLTR